jgi:hypothetical protein
LITTTNATTKRKISVTYRKRHGPPDVTGQGGWCGG